MQGLVVDCQRLFDVVWACTLDLSSGQEYNELFHVLQTNIDLQTTVYSIA